METFAESLLSPNTEPSPLCIKMRENETETAVSDVLTRPTRVGESDKRTDEPVSDIHVSDGEHPARGQ